MLSLLSPRYLFFRQATLSAHSLIGYPYPLFLISKLKFIKLMGNFPLVMVSQEAALVQKSHCLKVWEEDL